MQNYKKNIQFKTYIYMHRIRKGITWEAKGLERAVTAGAWAASSSKWRFRRDLRACLIAPIAISSCDLQNFHHRRYQVKYVCMYVCMYPHYTKKEYIIIGLFETLEGKRMLTCWLIKLKAGLMSNCLILLDTVRMMKFWRREGKRLRWLDYLLNVYELPVRKRQIIDLYKD